MKYISLKKYSTNEVNTELVFKHKIKSIQLAAEQKWKVLDLENVGPKISLWDNLKKILLYYIDRNNKNNINFISSEVLKSFKYFTNFLTSF
jgi:hypothetical protein